VIIFWRLESTVHPILLGSSLINGVVGSIPTGDELDGCAVIDDIEEVSKGVVDKRVVNMYFICAFVKL
jgi:hypothetical protein